VTAVESIHVWLKMPKVRYSQISYVPNVVEDRSIVIGVLLWRPTAELVSAYQRRDWTPVTQLDATADPEFLSATVAYLADQFRQADEPERQRLIEQMAMSISLSDPVDIDVPDPAEFMAQLVAALGL